MQKHIAALSYMNDKYLFPHFSSAAQIKIKTNKLLTFTVILNFSDVSCLIDCSK